MRSRGHSTLIVALAVFAGHLDLACAADSVITGPEWVQKPTEKDLVGAWPRNALKHGVQGRADLDCRVNVQGLAEDCNVVSEAPPNMGFGAAALTLTTQFQFRPATRDGKPFSSRIHLPISFKSIFPGQNNPLAMELYLLRTPPWAEAPLFSELGQAYPRNGGGLTGFVVFRCTVEPEGSLRSCDSMQEHPADHGFRSAGLRLLKRFRVDMRRVDYTPDRPLKVDVPIRFVDPASTEFTTRTIGSPQWIVGVDPETMKEFPDQAAKAGFGTGFATIDCVVAADGALTACTPRSADPPDLGFSELALKAATAPRMNRWTNGGGPIDGGTVSLPFRFNRTAVTR